MTPHLVADLHLELGEGPVWDEARGRLLFVDIVQGHVHAFDPETAADRVYRIGRPVGAVVPTVRGDWLLATGLGFTRIDPDTGGVTHIADVAPSGRDLRMNDGFVDPLGRFWAGTMSMNGTRDQATLYRLGPDGAVHPMLAPVTTSNGIDWSPDARRMYYIDSGTLRVDVFDCDPATGAIAHRRPFVRAEPTHGKPDGLVVDAEGALWVAFWQGGAVRRYTADGRLDREVRFPTSLVTKCAFGGPAYRDLYVTTAWIDLDPGQRAAEPHAGGLFRVDAGIAGRPPRLFAG